MPEKNYLQILSQSLNKKLDILLQIRIKNEEQRVMLLDENLTPEEKLKLEIADEIGVYDKVLKNGWRSLSAKESGRIGGMMTRKKRELLAGSEGQE